MSGNCEKKLYYAFPESKGTSSFKEKNQKIFSLSSFSYSNSKITVSWNQIIFGIFALEITHCKWLINSRKLAFSWSLCMFNRVIPLRLYSCTRQLSPFRWETNAITLNWKKKKIFCLCSKLTFLLVLPILQLNDYSKMNDQQKTKMRKRKNYLWAGM